MLTFENGSNICWFLSALQAIIHVPMVANLFREDELFQKMLFAKRKNACDFSSGLSDVIKQYWNSFEYEKTVSVAPLLDTFVKINRNFGGKRQYDATECFLKIVDTLETSFLPKTPAPLPETCDGEAWIAYTQKNSSTFLSDVFLGQTRQRFGDGTCGFDHFTGITISGTHDSVAKGIEEYLDDPDTKVSREIIKYPMILPIILQKNSDKHFVHYDLSMEIGPSKYELFAILLHVGNCHWITLAKGPSGWNLFDDSKMTKIDDVNSLIQKDAVMILYKMVR
jgi:ubiquitin C-terminal hydrolase